MTLKNEFNPKALSVLFALNTGKSVESEIEHIEIHLAPVHAVCIGKYKGVSEFSYQVLLKSLSDINNFHQMMRLNNQECYLYIKEDGKVYQPDNNSSYYVDSFSKPIGTLLEVPNKDSYDNCTTCLKTGKRYILEANF